MQDTAIIIPATDIKGEKSEQQLSRLLTSIEQGKWDGDTIVCFDACEEDFVEDFCKKFPFILPLSHRGNRLNFARNSNRGLRYACGILDKHALLVNQDTALPSLRFLEQLRGEGITSPHTYDLNAYSGDKEGDVEILDEESEKAGGTRDKVFHKFPFYAPFINKAVMQKIGFLDGVFVATFEDDDYITRALLAGFTCEIVDIKIYHEGSNIDTSQPGWQSASGSYNAARLGWNLNKYGTKYQVPKDIGHDLMIPWILEHHTWCEEMKVD